MWAGEPVASPVTLGSRTAMLLVKDPCDPSHSGREHFLSRNLIGLATPRELRVAEAVEHSQLGRLRQAGAFDRLQSNER